MKNITMLGQFAPPVTGEAIVNDTVLHLLEHNNFNVRVVNSSIIEDVNSVGKFSFKKIKRLLGVYKDFQSSIKKADLVYLTPGQTLFGVLRLLPVLYICQFFNVKVVAHWHGYGLLWMLPKYPRLLGYVGKSACRHIFLTQHLKLEINQISKDFDKSTVVNNYVEMSTENNATLKTNEQLRVIYLSSLMKEKGIDLFVTAAAAMPHVHFDICGSGSTEIQNRITEIADTSTNIVYHGNVSGSVKKDLLKRADIFVLQTHYLTEGVPLSILEAMSASCAIITTIHNGIPELMADSGIFVEKNNEKSLSSKINFLDLNRNILFEFQHKAYNRAKQFSKFNFHHKLINLIHKEIK